MSRPIVATWLRNHEPILTRSYSKIDNALPRMTYHMMFHAKPGDVIELSHRDTGMQLGTMKAKLGNKIESWWVWEE